MRKARWKLMLDADMNARYWKRLVDRYLKREKGVKIFLAIMTSGAVAGWGFWEKLPLLWKTLSSISAITAICSPILNFNKTIEQMSLLAKEWGELRIEYEDLWNLLEKDGGCDLIEQKYKKLRKTEANLQGKEIKLPSNEALLKKCFDEVKKARGLNQIKENKNER